jgi:phage portal protein BeeE
MGFWDRVKAAVTPKRKGTGVEVSRWISAPPRRGTVEALVAYREQPVLRTITEKISDNVASVPWKAYRITDGAKRFALRSAAREYREPMMRAALAANELTEVPDHPVLALLADPNDQLTGRATLKLAQTHVDIVGDAFFLLERRGSFVVGMWPVPPSWVTRLPDLTQPRGARTYQIRAGIVVREVPEADVLRFTNPDADDPLARGVGIGLTLGDELDSDEYIARFVKNSFYNNMVPPFIVGIEGLPPGPGQHQDQLKAWKETLAREHQGPQNAGKVAITNGKVSIARLDTSFKDMNLVEVRKYLHDFIRMTYGVPPEIIGDVSNSNKATAFAAREILAEQVIIPRLEFWRTEFQKRLVPLFGDDVILDYESPVPADRDHALKVMATQPEAFELNEFRELAGLKRLPELEGQFPKPLPGQPGGAPVQDPSKETGVDAPEEGADGAPTKAVGRPDPAWATGK